MRKRGCDGVTEDMKGFGLFWEDEQVWNKCRKKT